MYWLLVNMAKLSKKNDDFCSAADSVLFDDNDDDNVGLVLEYQTATFSLQFDSRRG